MRGRAKTTPRAAVNTAALVERVAAVPVARILNSADPDAPNARHIAPPIARYLGHHWEELLDDSAPAGLGDHPWDLFSPLELGAPGPPSTSAMNLWGHTLRPSRIRWTGWWKAAAAGAMPGTGDRPSTTISTTPGKSSSPRLGPCELGLTSPYEGLSVEDTKGSSTTIRACGWFSLALGERTSWARISKPCSVNPRSATSSGAWSSRLELDVVSVGTVNRAVAAARVGKATSAEPPGRCILQNSRAIAGRAVGGRVDDRVPGEDTVRSRVRPACSALPARTRARMQLLRDPDHFG